MDTVETSKQKLTDHTSNNKNTYNENIHKYIKGYPFEKGNKVKKRYFFNLDANYVIFLDSNNDIRYRIGSDHGCLDELVDLNSVVCDLVFIPYNCKKDLCQYLAKIYLLAFEDKIENAIKNIDLLKEMIVERKKIIKKITYISTPLLFSIVLMVLFYVLAATSIVDFEFYSKYKYLVLFATIGNYISVSHNLNKIEFYTHETFGFYILFSIFKYITSIFSAILLLLLYISGVINIKLNILNETQLIAILSTIGGYAEVMIPNIFEKMSKMME